MNIYENVLILNQALSEDESKAAVTRITDLIVASGGEILKTDTWGKRRLAYEINKQRMGMYVLLLFKAPPLTIRKIENFFKVFDPVIKFMITRLSVKQVAALPPEVLGVPVTPQEVASPAEPAIEG